VAALEERLQVRFGDAALALMALTHPSYLNEHPDEVPGHNERLEFLGDAVVDLAVSHLLMERFPTAPEGEMTRLRALVVSEEGLARVAREQGLGELLLLGRGEERSGGREKAGVLANALEAILGALYLGTGLPTVMALAERLFAGSIAAAVSGRQGGDFKTRLQEHTQQRLKVAPRYRVVGESGPENAKTFEVEVLIGEQPHGRACGRSKKEAEQAAARLALEGLLAAEAASPLPEGPAEGTPPTE
jgi:ribonuclease-3